MNNYIFCIIREWRLTACSGFDLIVGIDITFVPSRELWGPQELHVYEKTLETVSKSTGNSMISLSSHRHIYLSNFPLLTWAHFVVYNCSRLLIHTTICIVLPIVSMSIYAEYKDTPGMLNKQVQEYYLTLKITAATKENKVFQEVSKSCLPLWCYFNNRLKFKCETTCPSERWKMFRTVEHSMHFHSGSAKSYLAQVFNYDTSGKLMAFYAP